MKKINIVIAGIILAIVFLLIFMLPPFMMDMLLVINIAIALIVLLFALNVKEPLEFAVFPTLLLMITLFRLSLNFSSTRLILSNGGYAGEIIETFGSVVIGDNLVIGVIMFLILLVVQFVVITKGAERTAEVAARFTLDAMPGKQMAIDADLNSGIIDEDTARERRKAISREADFNGAMDGASKFIKGDAIVGILIVFINVIGGMIIGSMTLGLPLGEVARIYTLATIGDGLVGQIPAMLISLSAGIIVTRSDSGQAFGEEVSGQISSQPFAIIMAGVLLFVIGFIPGLPILLFWIVAVLVIIAGYRMMVKGRKAVVVAQEDEAAKAAEEKRKPESVMTLLEVKQLELRIGYGLLSMADAKQGGDLIERVLLLRRELAIDLGILVPPISLRDDVTLGANKYSLYIKGIEVAQGEVMADYLLALASGDVDEEIAGIPTTDPTFGIPALWIPKSERETAEMLGYSTNDPPTVIVTHLSETIRRHAHELLSRQTIQSLIDNLRRTQPALVDEVIPKMFSLGELQKILGALLEENVPIRDMATIVETLADFGNLTRDTEVLTEYVRQALSRTLSRRFIRNREARVITLDVALEQVIYESTKQTERGSYLSMDIPTTQSILSKLRTMVENSANRGNAPIVLTSPIVRRQVRELAEKLSPDLVVMSYNELEKDVDVISEGVVTL